jgi:hypothetical protein
MNKKRLLYWIVLWICIFVITNITTTIIINKCHKDYYEIGQVYCWENTGNPFLSNKEKFLYIYILDVKDGYVKDIHIDYPEDLDNVEQIAENYSYSMEINRLYPYFKKIK